MLKTSRGDAVNVILAHPSISWTHAVVSIFSFKFMHTIASICLIWSLRFCALSGNFMESLMSLLCRPCARLYRNGRNERVSNHLRRRRLHAHFSLDEFSWPLLYGTWLLWNRNAQPTRKISVFTLNFSYLSAVLLFCNDYLVIHCICFSISCRGLQSCIVIRSPKRLDDVFHRGIGINSCQ